ncbi:MAG TPA: SCP2 sterol-binding domain-containing protein [Acidimicrobiales bacterium]|nr:SCP2 sterol-binding domain-containing protein [Acidimicrobiales bacterium]
MAKYPFLSQEWMDEAKKIREEYRGKAPAGSVPTIKMNQVITDVPFGEGTIDAHMDSSSGEMEMDLGHIDGADLKLTVPYGVAKAIFVEGNPQAGMQAFMSGQIKVEGDMTKLMAMQGGAPDPTQAEIQEKIKEITE